jgi:hypothetical protein
MSLLWSGCRRIMMSIQCDCETAVDAPSNLSGSRTITTPCTNCSKEWVFVYDEVGQCVGHERSD